MAKDYFKALKEAPYPLFTAPKPYSFDLNEDMVKLIREDFNAEGIANKLAEAIKGKPKTSIAKIAKDILEQYGQNWMRKTMQIGDEYPDRTIEMVKETVDRNGVQFLVFPHVPQRFIEIAYLSNQQFLKLPVVLNNMYEFAYRIPKCNVFNQIKEKCGDDVAKQMHCKHACLKALDTLRQDMELDVVINMDASTAKDGFCEFSMKKL